MGELHQSRGILIVDAPGGYFRFPPPCSVSKPEFVKCDWCRESRQNL